MGVTVIWDNVEHTILRHIYDGKWEWKDMNYALIEAYRLIDVEGHRVDFIIDIRSSSYVPPNFVTGIKMTGRRQHPNQGIVVLVGATPYISGLMNLASRLNPTCEEKSMVATLEEARAVITRQRERTILHAE